MTKQFNRKQAGNFFSFPSPLLSFSLSLPVVAEARAAPAAPRHGSPSPPLSFSLSLSLLTCFCSYR